LDTDTFFHTLPRSPFSCLPMQCQMTYLTEKTVNKLRNDKNNSPIRLRFAFFFLMGWVSVHWVLRPLFGLFYQPQMIDDDEDVCGAIGGMRIGGGVIRSTWRKPAPTPHYSPQILHDMTRAAVVGSRPLTAWAMAQSYICLIYITEKDLIKNQLARVSYTFTTLESKFPGISDHPAITGLHTVLQLTECH
jgi:hypothetical protein